MASGVSGGREYRGQRGFSRNAVLPEHLRLVVEDLPDLGFLQSFEPLGEIMYGGACLQVFEDGVEGNPGVLEDPDTAHPVGFSFHCLAIFPGEPGLSPPCVCSGSVSRL